MVLSFFDEASKTRVVEGVAGNGKALDFDGKSWVELKANKTLDIAEIAMSAWIYKDERFWLIWAKTSFLRNQLELIASLLAVGKPWWMWRKARNRNEDFR